MVTFCSSCEYFLTFQNWNQIKDLQLTFSDFLHNLVVSQTYKVVQIGSEVLLTRITVAFELVTSVYI